MKNNLRRFTILLLIIFICSSTVSAFQFLEKNRIFFNGYQTSSKIVSEIGDNNLSDKYKYKVEAIVYVGNTRYSSGFKNDYAYRSANRSFWSNETARYNYITR